MEKLKQEANQAKSSQVKEGTVDQQRAVRLTMMYSELDQEEIRNTYEEQNQFIELAMRFPIYIVKICFSSLKGYLKETKIHLTLCFNFLDTTSRA